MPPRLDPACPDARALQAQHRQQTSLLVGDPETQLAGVVRATQEKQVDAHARDCPRCLAYVPACPECGGDPRGRHGWMCRAQPARWKDLLPWNWRPRSARGQAPSAHVAPAGAAPSASRAPASARAPPAPPAPQAPAPARPAATPTPGGGSVAHRAASSAPKPRPKPTQPKPDALQLAYQTLGVSPSAREDEVRAAYRAKAQQYHPDKVATMAPEFRALAEQKMQEINHAYERIKRAR